MKASIKLLGAISLLLFLLSTPAFSAQSPVEDITKETIVGPGSVTVQTGKDILMSFGAMIRMIPTNESSWDFGMSDKVSGYVALPDGTGGLRSPLYGKQFFKDHFNESGWLNNGYIRSENRLYFNAMPKDRKWSFYAALEFDKALDTNAVDSRGGRDNDTSNFGLERLHGTMALPFGMRLHAGWDIWGVDIIDGASTVYGDDNPGFWITGSYGSISFNIGYFKLAENDFASEPTALNNTVSDDRDLYGGYLTWKPTKENKIQFFYLYDRIRNIRVTDLLGRFSGGYAGTTTSEYPETDSHHIGAYWVGNFGGLELFAEGVYQFGSADDTGLSQDDFDISAFALAADISYDFKKALGFTLRPHIGILYTSGDDDPNDDELNGYTAVESGQRFSKRWGGECTIVGDTNFVLGTVLYGYLPELYGNGTPVATGGLQNVAGLGAGRGDNPGLTLVSVGLTFIPKRFIIYKTNVNIFRWNEDFVVQNWVTPLNPVTGRPNTTTVKSGYVGTEWDNELTLALSKHTFIKGQAAFFFAGDGVEDVTEALGAKSDDTAMRFAAEFIWNF